MTVGEIDTPVLLVGEQVGEAAVEGLKGDVLRVAERLLEDGDFDVFGRERFRDLENELYNEFGKIISQEY